MFRFARQMILAGILVPVFNAPVSAELRSSPIPPERPDRPGGAVLVQVSTSNLAFERWIEGFRDRALARGIQAKVFDRAFRNVRYNTDVIAKDRNQSEFTKQIWDYLDSAASPTRVKNGQAALKKHARVLKAVEAKYGVDRHIVAAIWGLESAYGEFKGDIPTIEALATLAFDGRRGAFFEAQLIDALKILQSGDVTAAKMKGSWAGAMGHTQFIPSSYHAFAVDFTGDGKRDIWGSNPADALGSTAAYLARSGWNKGQPWGVEVVLPRGFTFSQANRKILKSPAEWGALGIKDINGRVVPNYGRASILLPAGANGAAFMIFDNFAVIERYNKADAYVIGVGHLADRLRGGPEIKATWPRGYKPLSFKQKKEMQRRLKRAGFLDDKIDGIIGPNTINAIRAYQQSRGVTPDGYASQELLKLLKTRS
ncbi:murein transglycosylase [Actibacterium mucosum KCTC 23349]|uniref:Murein transglycosylase n=1 Tax=Actibacterium mucosum KCTC 23349 TaxID=1454373 RepID=A0A037ZLY5_9RHOB|nr:lytic murein transglycosylase [Actibacterium mucosum]KAJ57416.1 murein transglycosylase [Actibacterium mucosum KCTC 23349]